MSERWVKAAEGRGVIEGGGGGGARGGGGGGGEVSHPMCIRATEEVIHGCEMLECVNTQCNNQLNI